MGIILDKTGKIFTLQTQNTTYQMKVGKLGHLFHLYYGKKIENADLSYVLFDAESHFAAYPYENEDRTGSLNILPQEFPSSGTGDMRGLAFDIENSDGTHVADLKFKAYEILDEKYQLEKLPSFHAAPNETVQTLKITLADDIVGLEVDLLYGVFIEKDVISRSVIVRNLGQNPVRLKKVQSLALDFITGDFDLLHFQGRWAMERRAERMPLRHAQIRFGSNYGISGNRQNPGFLLADPTTTEELGDCYGFNLVYSGNFTATAEQSSLGQNRVTLGLGDEHFSWLLSAGQSFVAPEAIMSFSSQGFASLSHHFHDLIRENLTAPSKWQNLPRPVPVNNWEATYFNFDGQKLIDIAKAGKEIGADMLVMDDGWFGNRFDDNRGLGDWFVNEDKLGMSLSDLSVKIHQTGMKFGIWIEPEMVNEDSDLYRAHPDWTLNFPNRKPLLGRNQLNLDFSKKEVRDYLFTQLTKVFDSAQIDYVKWDMNRPISDWYSADLSDQGELQHRYVLGLYDFMSRLIARYPDVLWEGCSSGGARFDLGMLAYEPQIWTSDNNDPINRLKIQYGTSFFYPISSMGAHVGPSTSYQSGRSTSLQTRAHVASSGTFGYELDVTKMSEQEKALARILTENYKARQNLIFTGDYYRLTNPFEKAITAWQVVAKDGSETLVTAVATDTVGNPAFEFLKLHGLKPNSIYLTVDNCRYTGASLMNLGLKLPQANGDFPSQQIYLKEIKQ